ncbi:MAG: hypothetical protein J5759_04135 [Bacteroidales bacterium]|nr:hypothetical protein [Bacteroidales bacterium]
MQADGAYLHAAVYGLLQLAGGISGKTGLYRRQLQDKEPAEQQYYQEPDYAGDYISCLSDD